MTPKAVPYPAVARLPVLQWVRILTKLLSGTLRTISRAPKFPIDMLSATSFVSISSILSMNLRHKFRDNINQNAHILLQQHRVTRIYLSFIWNSVHVASLLRLFARPMSSLAAVFMLTAVGRAVNR